MLKIKNLHVKINDKPILKGLNLEVNEGEVHAIMGPNGSGKSTLSKVIAGHPDIEVTDGTIEFEVDMQMKSLLEMSADERAKAGVFLAFQYPVEIPGVNNLTFLKAAFDAICEHQGVAPMNDKAFRELVIAKSESLHLGSQFLDRGVNSGFSGGEKKRNEILQMAVLNPRLSFLDETDSGLDIDALKIAAEGINKLRSPERSFVLVTHYQRMLDYVIPDFVHVMVDGRIVKTGDKQLAKQLEAQGYDRI